MRVNIFKSVRAPWPQETELDQIVCKMQSSQELYLRTLLYRKIRASGDKTGAEQMKISKFPAFAPCALFYGGKSRNHVLGLTDLCYLDFDHVEEEKRLINAINKLRDDRNVLLASRSVSNEGLHILIRYKLKDMELPPQINSMTPDEMQELYGEVYDYFAAKYLQKLGLMPDYQAGHMERLYIVSYDPDLYYNPVAETLTINLDEPITGDGSRPFVLGLGEKLREAERLTSRCCLDEAEKLLLECREWIVSNTFRSNEDSEDVTELPRLDDYLAQITDAKPKIARVCELMEKVDEDLRTQDIRAAHEKIVESQHILKTITGLCKSGIGKIRKRVVNNEMRLGAINRELRKKRYEERLAG